MEPLNNHQSGPFLGSTPPLFLYRLYILQTLELIAGRLDMGNEQEYIDFR